MTIMAAMAGAVPMLVYPVPKECHGDRSEAEWSHPLFSAAEPQGGSTSLAMTVWQVEIYLLGNCSKLPTSATPFCEGGAR